MALPTGSTKDTTLTDITTNPAVTQTFGGITKSTGIKPEYLMIAGVVIAVLLLKRRK